MFVTLTLLAMHTVSADKVIVVVDTQKASSPQLKTKILESQQDIVNLVKNFELQGKAKEVRQLWIINAIALDATPDVIEELKKKNGVRVIPDYKVKLLETAQTLNTETTWNFELINVTGVWSLGINGSGVKVAIVDTGINADHSELVGKVIAWADFVSGQSSTPYDDNGHGTHVAGVIAGNTVGVAPGVSLIVAKAFDSSGSGWISDIIEAFQWAVENGANVISYSAGALPVLGSFEKGFVQAGREVHINLSVEQYSVEPAFKPASILINVFSDAIEDLNLTLYNPSNIQVNPTMQKDLANGSIVLNYMSDQPLQPGNWTLKIESNASSNKMWYSGYGNNLNNNLIRTFDLRGVSNATLLFNTTYSLEAMRDFGYVEINTSDGWLQIASFTGESDWTEVSINLTPYVGNNVTIRFRYVTDSTAESLGWFVDNIRIPEIGFSDTVDYVNGILWDYEGWEIVDNPAYYRVEYSIVYESNGTDLLSQAVDSIISNGTVVVVAAGNEGELGFRTINSPACSNAIAVGAVDAQGIIADFSSRGPVGWGSNERIKPDIVAPGVDIKSAYQGGYAVMSGTSSATPHVSGVVALMLQVNPLLTPEEIKSILKSTALDLGDVGEDNLYGAGLVDAYKACRTATLQSVKGDFNNNGEVDIGDVSYIACMVVGKVKPDLEADFNGNGRVDIGDVVMIAYYLVGMVNGL